MEIRRDKYLDLLIHSCGNGLIKVITGMRRCGKSYLLFTLFKNYLIKQGVKEDHIIGVNLENRLNKSLRDPDALLHYIDSRLSSDGQYYVMLDEVQMVSEFEDWCFDPGRQSGDTDIIKSEYGYHVMYFVETNPLPYWEYKATNTLKSSAVNDWYDAITDGVTAEQLDAIEYVG